MSTVFDFIEFIVTGARETFDYVVDNGTDTGWALLQGLIFGLAAVAILATTAVMVTL